MRKIDNDRVQSFHLQSQRRILGVKWYDEITNTVQDNQTNGSTFPHHRLTPLTFWSADYPGIHLFHKHYIYPLMPPATDWKHPPGRPRRAWLQTTGGRRYGSTHQCLSIRNSGLLIVEITTTAPECTRQLPDPPEGEGWRGQKEGREHGGKVKGKEEGKGRGRGKEGGQGKPERRRGKEGRKLESRTEEGK